MRPNFFIVGAPKCGTTAWVSYLGDHPEISFAVVKEPHYFCTDFPGFRWAETEAEYLGHFADLPPAPVIGEASVMYLYSREAARRIHEFDPASRILILLREQGELLPSYHNQILYTRIEDNPDFAEAWRLSGQRPAEALPPSCAEPSFLDYVAIGDFETQVGRYLDAFPASQIRVAWMEDWLRDPARFYRALESFLGVAHHPRPGFDRLNAAHRHRSRALAHLTNRPSARMLQVAAGVKRMLGLRRLSLADRLRRLNRTQGYAAEMPDELRREISSHYSASNARLRVRLARLGVNYA